MPQQVELNKSKTNGSEVSDNNNKQHVSNQNEVTQLQRSKRSRQPQQHIYENLPASATSLQLRKYFRREAIYENLCRGCGYGVFAAQGRYCHFCQCIVSGSVAAALQQQPTPSGSGDCNIYENICELCRGIYSDSEACKCATSATPTELTVNDTPQIQTSLPTATPTAAKTTKSRTLLGYSKSSAATLTRLFGSLKHLNRSGSLQRRLFQKESSGCPGKGGGGSLEIIHNVDEVFRTQETFDMQRICELKRQLQCSRSDQHIYGRLRGEREPELEPDPPCEPESVKSEDQLRKKPRISRMRLLRQNELEPEPVSKQASLYLNESICQWMNALRRELHSYEDAKGGLCCQQPKSVPPAYERERERELELKQSQHESESVTLRRTKSTTAAAAVEPAATTTLQQRMVNDFKRKLLAQREPQQLRCQLESQLEPQLELFSERRRRRCGINERHDAAFVCEFLSGLAVAERETLATTVTVTSTPAAAALLASRFSLKQLWENAALAAGLNGSVICFFGYDKFLSAFLHVSQRRQQQQQRLRSAHKVNDKLNIERWLRRYRRLCESANCNNNNAERESAAEHGQRRLLGPSSSALELVVVPATPPSDDVAFARRVGSDKRTKTNSTEQSQSESESETKTRSKRSSDENSSSSSSALMAAPKQSGDVERTSCDDSENNSNNNNNNNNYNNNNSNNININSNKEQMQQQQHYATQNCVIKVRRPAPQVPVRNPSTSLSKPNNEHNNNNEMDKFEIESIKEEVKEKEEEEEESIYHTIWQFKTLEPVADNEDEEFEIIAAAETASDDDDDVDVDDAEAEAEALTLQAAAAFAAGARHRLTKQAASPAASAATSPLPSPTASMDHGAWETDDEFMFAKADEQQQLEQREREREQAETLSVGSTVTNSTATLGSISSAASSCIESASAREPKSTPAELLTHPVLRNICIFYSLKEPQKFRAIFYEYQRAQVHQNFMTRIRRPAPPPPTAAAVAAAKLSTALSSLSNDDSGCSCETEYEDLSESIPQPLKEDWALAVLAAAASSKRGVAARAGRKLRVRSSARRLIPTSVLAWREQLQDVNCCEDEEDMIVPVTDILRAQQIQEENELQQTQPVPATPQTTILQRFKSASIGNLVDLPGEDDKKSIKTRMRMKLNSNVFRINSPKSEKKSRTRRIQVTNSWCQDEQSKYPLFETSLNALELNMTDHPFVPRFVVDICTQIERADCIDQDGIYRASGNKLYVDELKRKLTHLYDPRLLVVDDIHTLTSLHKQFFRELPTPLITQEAYDSLGRCLTDDAALERMRIAFDEMPEPNRSTLRFVIKHLTKVAECSASNRMPASNLAIVWGPCLLAANNISFDIGRMNMLAKVLIENFESIFRPANERLVC